MYNNKRLVLSIFYVVLGLTLTAVSIAGVSDSPYLSGMGGGLTVVGALQLIRNLRYRNDKDYREKVDTEMKDERNSFLRMKSWAWTGYIVVLAEGIGVLVAWALGQEQVMQVLSYSVCLILCVYWITWLILSRKY